MKKRAGPAPERPAGLLLMAGAPLPLGE